MFCALRPNLAAAVASTSTSAEQAVASFSVFNAATPTENVRPLSLTRAAAAAAAASVALPVMLFAYLLCSLLLLLLVLQPYLFAHSQHSNWLAFLAFDCRNTHSMCMCRWVAFSSRPAATSTSTSTTVSHSTWLRCCVGRLNARSRWENFVHRSRAILGSIGDNFWARKQSETILVQTSVIYE